MAWYSNRTCGECEHMHETPCVVQGQAAFECRALPPQVDPRFEADSSYPLRLVSSPACGEFYDKAAFEHPQLDPVASCSAAILERNNQLSAAMHSALQGGEKK